MNELKQFYKDLGIHYIKQFDLKNELMSYFESNAIKGDKKKFALAYTYNEETKQIMTNTTGAQFIPSCGHVVAVRVDKSGEKGIFRVIDFQVPVNDPNRLFKNGLPPNANPPFHLFEKIPY